MRIKIFKKYWEICRIKKEPGDNLLSHGETPHYHRRAFLSLLSSIWIQVGQNGYRRQAKLGVVKMCIQNHSIYMVKSISLLVQVSYTHYCASTPCLSTSQSPTDFMGKLILREASRLDAFSGYPFRTQLPGNATGVTTGTPEVRPLRSSRTRSSSSQFSYAHGRQGPNCLTTF